MRKTFIQKYYEFTCSKCGWGHHPPCNSLKDAKKWWRENLGTISNKDVPICGQCNDDLRREESK